MCAALESPPTCVVNTHRSFNVHGIIYISEDGWSALHHTTLTDYGHCGRGYCGTCRTRNSLASNWALSGQG